MHFDKRLANTLKIVAPGTVSGPDKVVGSALRCAGEAWSLITTNASAFPS
jgi:hypothetical protein